jgi:hypothetical protein
VRQLGAEIRQQPREALERRVATVRRRQQAARLAKETQALAFRHGYVVRPPGSPVPSAVQSWTRRDIAGFTYHLHPSTRLAVAGEQVVLLGHPVDVDAGTASAPAIAQRLLEVRASGTDEVLRAAGHLGGRWTLFLHEGDRLTVAPDALASQDVWFHPDTGAIGSHEELVDAGTLLRPNSLLTVGWSREDRERREVAARPFWSDPVQEPSSRVLDAESRFSAFRERLVAHTRLLCSLGRPAAALTAGPASRAVLAAYLNHPREDGLAFTTFAPSSARTSLDPAVDMFTASHLAQVVRVPHRVLQVVTAGSSATTSEPEPIAQAYRQTFPSGQRPGVARAHAWLPEGTVQLHSAGAEVVDQATWADTAAHRSGHGFPEGDLAHRVLLPFNDRRLLQLMLGTATDGAPGGWLVARMAAELPALPRGLDTAQHN